MAAIKFTPPPGHVIRSAQGLSAELTKDDHNAHGDWAAKASYGAQATSAVNTVLPDGSLMDPLSSVDAEFELCGWLLRMNENDLPMAERFFDRIGENDFAHPIYRNIIGAARFLVARNQVCGATAVLDYAQINQIDVGGAKHLAQLINDPIGMVADEQRLNQDVDIILDYALRRRIRFLLSASLEDLATKPVALIVNELADVSLSLQNDAKVIRSEPRHISEIMNNVLVDLFDETPNSAPISTGIPELDHKLNGGIRDEDLVVIAGRPAMGKTAIALNSIGRNISFDTRHERPVLMYSLEMPAAALANRMLASEAGIPAKLFRNGQANEADFHNALAEVMPRFAPLQNMDGSSSRLWIDDTPGLTLADVRARSRAFARKFGRPIIIVDYLQLLAGAEGDSKAVGAVSTGLKGLARELKTPVIALSQLNRSLESRTNKQPIMSDLRESGSIEQDADIILFLYRDVVYNPDTPDPDEALVIVGKQREGENGPVALRFNGPLVRYESRLSGSTSHVQGDDFNQQGHDDAEHDLDHNGI